MPLNPSDDNSVFELYYSMLRGSSGFYTTAPMTHRAQDETDAIGAWGALTGVPVGFNLGERERHTQLCARPDAGSCP